MRVLNKSILNLPLRFTRLYIYAVYGNLGATLPFWEGGHQWLHFTHENAEVTAKVKFVRVESNMGTWNAIKKVFRSLHPILPQISTGHCSRELMAPKRCFDHSKIFSQVTTIPGGSIPI